MSAIPSDADARRRFFADARRRVIHDQLGGESVYALLKSRNPEIDLLLNAGIAAGLTLSEDEDEDTAPWLELLTI